MFKKIIRKIILITSLLCAFVYAQNQGEWVWKNPGPQGNRLTNIHVFADGEILAVGYNGTTLRSYNNGQDWEVEYRTLGPDVHQIDRMQFVDDSTGWALETDLRTVYYTTDRGKTWNIRNSNTIYLPKYFYALDDQQAWITGLTNQISRTTDGGITWNTYDISLAGEFTAGGIFFLNQVEGWVVGSNGALGGDNHAKIYHTFNGGLTWTELFTDTVQNTAVGQVFFLNDSIGWVGGTDATIMATVDGGHTWTLQYHREYTNYAILDIHFFDVNHGIAVGTDGLIVTTSDGGQTWEEQDGVTEVWIRDIDPANGSTIWACGEVGLLMRSDDGGLTWVLFNHTVTTSFLNCVEFVDEMTGWVGGPANGILLKTEDGGDSWFVADSGEHPIMIVQFLDPLNGYRIEYYGQTYRTRDGGNTWEFTDVLGRDGSYQNGFFADTSRGWLSWNYLGDGYIKQTSDGGQNWQIVLNTPDIWLWEIDFVNDSIGWVCGADNYSITNQQGYIYKTTDGGLTWQQQTSVSQPLYEIDFIDENAGWCVGARGKILKTTNGGQTWNQVYTPFLETLTEVIFFDANTGWIVGNDGVRRTFDGGLTWETYSMPHGQNYLYGAADFTNIDNGWLVGATGHILKFESNPSTIANYNQENLPEDFELLQNYPNPFNPKTRIQYRITQSTKVKLEIFNALGQKISTLVNKNQQAGVYLVEWDGSKLSSGVYYYRLKAGNFIQTKKMMLLR